MMQPWTHIGQRPVEPLTKPRREIMLASFRTFLKRILPEMGRFLVMLSVSLLAVSFYFGEQRPDRWIALSLILILLGVSVIAQMDRWWEQRPWLRHVFILLQMVLIVALMLLPPQYGFYTLLFFVLSGTVPMLFPQRVWRAYIASFAVITAVVLYITAGIPGLITSFIYAGGYYFFASFATVTARAQASQAESQKLLEELQAANLQLQDYAGRVEELAVAEERNRLAREMHDTLGHRLTVAAVQLEGAQRLVARDADRAAAMVGTVREQVLEALGELRRTVATLRAPVEVNLSLPSALQRLARAFQEATGIVVHLDIVEPAPRLPDPQRLALYRAMQEGLTNVQRHAEADEAWVQLGRENGLVVLQVCDNGAGLPVEVQYTGFGLRGLEERAHQLGGTLSLAPRSGGGAELTLQLPLPREDGDDA